MLGVIGNRFSIGKETYQPFAVELHYFRIEKRYWSICFERIKRAGFRIIATAVPWSVHQLSDKSYDFIGSNDPRKDLVVFLELAREFGFKVILRPGPAVSGQLPYGGMPKYLFGDVKLLARDKDNKEIELPKDSGVEAGYLPSYLHNNFQFNLRNYLKAFIEVTKNYVHPRGPVFMVELDFETSFGRLLDPGSADYNTDVLAKYYPPFLEQRFEDIKKLNNLYKEKNKEFSLVEPPRKFDDLDIKDYPKVFDWFRFREYMLNTYLEELEDIFRSYTVEPLIFRSLYFEPGGLMPAYNLVPNDRQPFLGGNVFPEGNYFDLVVKARFLQSEYGFAFASSFTSGSSAVDSKMEARVAPVTNHERRFYFAASLAAGFSGINHYMFVDREHWQGAPLHSDGTISDGYDLSRKFNTAVQAVGIEEMTSNEEIAVVSNRLYYWMNRTQSKKHFPYLSRLINKTLPGICRDLMRLKLPFGVRENRDWETMKKYKLLIIPSTEVMAEKDQEAIVELIKGGVSVILVGVMPKYDDEFKDCQVLANMFRIKTTADLRIASIVEKGIGDFPTYVYGWVRSSDDSKTKKLVKADGKLVAACSSKLKGNLYLFTYDLASGGNHQKLSFIENVLAGENHKSFLYCSDPSVDVSFRSGTKKGVLTIVAPPPGELSDAFETGTKEVIVKADLRPAGLKSAKLRLTDFFADEETPPMRITAKELREGIPLQINYPDGHIYFVEEKAR